MITLFKSPKTNAFFFIEKDNQATYIATPLPRSVPAWLMPIMAFTIGVNLILNTLIIFGILK